MFFQRFMKGICFDDALADDALANEILFTTGICANLLRKYPIPLLGDVEKKLTERNLLWHLSHYEDPDPLENNEEFYKHTPFISTTAGAVERDKGNQQNIQHSPFLTSLRFATRDFWTTGYIFYGHLYTLGKESIPLAAFAEEVRELHIYSTYLPYQLEGEITAKIRIPAHCLDRWEKYDGPAAYSAIVSGTDPTPVATVSNADYAEPLAYANVRGFIE